MVSWLRKVSASAAVVVVVGHLPEVEHVLQRPVRAVPHAERRPSAAVPSPGTASRLKSVMASSRVKAVAERRLGERRDAVRAGRGRRGDGRGERRVADLHHARRGRPADRDAVLGPPARAGAEPEQAGGVVGGGRLHQHRRRRRWTCVPDCSSSRVCAETVSTVQAKLLNAAASVDVFFFTSALHGGLDRGGDVGERGRRAGRGGQGHDLHPVVVHVDPEADVGAQRQVGRGHEATPVQAALQARVARQHLRRDQGRVAVPAPRPRSSGEAGSMSEVVERLQRRGVQHVRRHERRVVLLADADPELVVRGRASRPRSAAAASCPTRPCSARRTSRPAPGPWPGCSA